MVRSDAFSGARPWAAALVLGVSALVAACGGGGGRDTILGSGDNSIVAPLPVVPVVPVIPPVVVPPIVPVPPVVPPVPVPVPPVVIAVAPANKATGVALNNTLITAAFNEPVAAFSGAASFTLACAAPCVSPTGTVSLDATGKIATLALTAGTVLVPLTSYTATVAAARSVASGLALVSPKVWRFTTGAAPDVTRPGVALTAPVTSTPGPTTGVPANSAISAVFSEAMAPATIDTGSFRLSCAAPCTTPAGVVTYSVGNRTAVFNPTGSLAAGTTYTATISTAATDLAGNALGGNQAPLPAASNYVWTFRTVAAIPAANISVLSTNPTAGSTTVCADATVNATFAVPSGQRLDPDSINSAVFTLTGPALLPVAADSVVLDAGTGRTATFTPLVALTPGVTYTATINGGNTGVKDLALPANTMTADFSWKFSVASCVLPPVIPVINLGLLSRFGTFGGSAGMTNMGNQTIITGSAGNTADIGTIATGTSAITGFHDSAPSDIYTEVPGVNVGSVTGKIYTCTTSTTGPTNATNGVNPASCVRATQARLDGQAAYLALTALPAGANPGANLAGLTLAPGVYTAPGGSLMIQGGNLTLDAQGDANAVWVFQMATSLTVGGPGAAFPQSVTLTGGALAKNVYWQVGSAATINAAGGGTMVGTIISQAGAAFSTAGNALLTTLNGRAVSLGASVTLVNTVINVPAP
ncbi:MAG: Ig-like domain-containing protein [Pseudomonadota bacterium]